MAEKLFTDNTDEHINNHLKEQFSKGIRDYVLRAKAIDKFHKMQGKDYPFTKFLEYMVGKEAGREDFNRSTSGTDSEDQRRGYMRSWVPYGGPHPPAYRRIAR